MYTFTIRSFYQIEIEIKKKLRFSKVQITCETLHLLKSTSLF